MFDDKTRQRGSVSECNLSLLVSSSLAKVRLMLDDVNQYKFTFDKEEICCQAFKIVPKSGKRHSIGWTRPTIFA